MIRMYGLPKRPTTMLSLCPSQRSFEEVVITGLASDGKFTHYLQLVLPVQLIEMMRRTIHTPRDSANACKLGRGMDRVVSSYISID